MTDCALLTDKRRIVLIRWPDGVDGAGYQKVGHHGVTSIEVESVAGNGAYVPWIVVRNADGDARYNPQYLDCIQYAPGVTTRAG